jgi:enoyl-CoA hydratase
MRIGNQNAVMGLPEVSLGLIPGWGGTQRLSAVVGKAKATELILTGNFVKADEALQLGLLNKIADNPAEEADTLLSKIFKQGPIAIKMAIQAIRASGHPSGYKKESNLFGDLFSTADFKEGTSAFLEKRKAEFSGK